MSMTTVLQSVTIIIFSMITVIHCYVLSPAADGLKSWIEAQTYCADKGKLASIHSADDDDEARAACLPSGSNCWIGLYQANAGDPYEWDDGTAIDYGFINNDATMPVPGAGNPWGIGQPSNPNRLCVHLWRGAHYSWDDDWCSIKKFALCNGVSDCQQYGEDCNCASNCKGKKCHAANAGQSFRSLCPLQSLCCCGITCINVLNVNEISDASDVSDAPDDVSDGSAIVNDNNDKSPDMFDTKDAKPTCMQTYSILIVIIIIIAGLIILVSICGVFKYFNKKKVVKELKQIEMNDIDENPLHEIETDVVCETKD